MATQLDERQWRTFASVPRMLNDLRRNHKAARTALGRRKLRLFACACCRSLCWHLPVPEPYRAAMQAAEQFAEGLIGREQLPDCLQLHQQLWVMHKPTSPGCTSAAEAMLETLQARPFDAARLASQRAQHVTQVARTMSRKDALRQTADLLREIFGNPFQPIEVDRTWMTWKHGTIPSIAKSIYKERRFEELPVLADALEEAGCQNAELLDHCRRPGGHYLGCWAVDVLVGKA